MKSGPPDAARDVRREGQLVGGTHRKHKVTYEVDPAAKNEQLAVRTQLAARPLRIYPAECIQYVS